jgi:mono/diheme cytochrome c family protein
MVRAVWTVVLALGLTGCVDEATPVSAPPVRGAVSVRDPEMEAALIEDGRAIAEMHCASCHAIGTSGESPDPKAPWFRSVLSRYDVNVLETELILGMRVAHEPMPQFQFEPGGATALIAYLRSVQTRAPGLALVEQRCARCHASGQSDVSPYPGAQPFRNLGRRWRRGQLRDALKAGIIAEHDTSDVRLPPMKLTDPEIDAFFAYLESIATAKNPAPMAP